MSAAVDPLRRLGPCLALAALLVLGCQHRQQTAAAPAAPLPRVVLPQLTIPTSYRPCQLPPAAAELPGIPRCPGRAGRGSRSPDFAFPVSIDTGGPPLGWSAPHRAALAALISGRLRDADEVMTQLALALDQGRSAELLSDAAAAHFVRAQELGKPSELVAGLESALAAVKLDAQLPAAQFNRGLLCRELGLTTCSSESWEAYLRRDATSPWSDEVRRYQAELLADRRQPVGVRERLGDALARTDLVLLRHLSASYPATAQRWVSEELLDEWSAAVRHHEDAKAGELRVRALDVAATLARHGHGSGLQRVVAALETTAGWRRTFLARGHRDYARGMRLLDGGKPSAAEIRFAAAERALRRGGSPFAVEAELQRITCLALDTRYAATLEATQRVERVPGLDPAVAARAAWLRGVSETQLRRPLAAVASYRRASRLYQQAGDLSNLVNTDARLAEMLEDVDQREAAWSFRRRALKGMENLEEPTRRPFVWGAATEAARAGGWVEAARLFQQQGVVDARRAGNELWLAEALRQSANVSLDAGRDEEARTQLDEASDLVADAADNKIRQAVELKLEELQGRAALARDPRAARRHFETAIGHARSIGQPVYLSALHLERAEALERAAKLEGSDAGEEVGRALRAAVDLIEDEWESTLEHRLGSEQEPLWPTYFGSRRRPFDRLIRRLYEAGDVAGALSIAEKARAREVLDLLSGPASLQPGVERLFAGPARPLAAAELVALVPQRTALVEYAFAEDQLLTWVVGRDGVRFVGSQPAGEVVALAAALGPALRAQTSEVQLQETLASLFDRLVAPFAANLRPLERVVVVADGVLHAVPFAALYDRSTHHYWIQDRPLSAAPSATLYVYTVSRNRELRVEPAPSVLAIGDPAFDPAQFRDLGLGRLHGAAAESQAVAALYGSNSLLLAPREATKRRVLAELGRHSVVHFAGHAIGHPWAAYLVLAADEPGEPSSLYGSELLSRPPGKTRLVFLSACSSAGEQAARGQGVAALVRPLIGAGIPAVVGTLWPVDDDAATEVARAFHRHLLAGKDAPAALQAAQIDLLRHRQPKLQLPQAWAAFVVVGHASLQEAERED